jgi:hemoglobin
MLNTVLYRRHDRAHIGRVNHGLRRTCCSISASRPDASIECVEEHEVYSAIGEETFQKLVAAFYSQVPADDILGPMYRGRDLAAAEQRLRGFLIYRFGGPQDYIAERGHPRLRMRHAPFHITEAARDRWLQLMTSALDSTPMPGQPKEILRGFFTSTATFLINRLAETPGP